jgi:hypothetical protein
MEVTVTAETVAQPTLEMFMHLAAAVEQETLVRHQLVVYQMAAEEMAIIVTIILALEMVLAGQME